MLCHFAHTFPDFVAAFLERGTHLRRRFREESVTDLMMASLVSLGRGFIIVEFPDEAATGADMEWNFVNKSKGTFFRILLQAKRLYGDGKFWARHSYPEILKETPSKELQVKILCDWARSQPSAYPMYILYNKKSSCNLCRNSGVTNVAGINLVDGYFVETLAQAATSQQTRMRATSLGSLYKAFFSLVDLFCPQAILPMGPMAYSSALLLVYERGQFGFPIPPRPEDIRERILNYRRSAPVKTFSQLTSVPEISNTVPAEIQSILRGEVGASLDRWRITFVSASPTLDIQGTRRSPG